MSLSSFFIVWRTFKNYRWHLLGLVLLGLVGALLEGISINAAIPLLSFLIGAESAPLDIVSNILRGFFALVGVDFSFRFLLALIVLLFLVRAVVLAIFGYLRGWITADFLYNETSALVRRLLSVSWSFLLRQKLGTVHNTTTRDLQRTATLLGSVSQAIQSFTGFLIYLLVALSISPLMTFCTILGGGVLLILVRPFLSRTRGVGESMANTEKQFSQFLTEHTIGMKSIKTAGVQAASLKVGDTILQFLRQLQIRLAFIVSLSGSFFQPFMIFFVIGLFALMYHLPGFNIVSFAATLYLIQKIFTYLESGQSSLHTISELVPYAEQIISFKRELESNKEGNQKVDNPFLLKSELRFADVSFSYPESGLILCNVDFAVKAGETTAIIGPSGGGKTSLADLLLRMFECQDGQIFIDGRPATEIGLTEWRLAFGYVSQDPFLLNDTIEENIRFYSDVSHEDIVSAAKQANIYDFVMGLPEGFKTTTGDRGVMLSGGQRQRIVLARALARKPAVLILDEATSALDQESERLIQESIRNLHGKVTVLVIAHRLSTVENADRIVVLDGGRITEQGSPAELLKNPQSYFSRHYHRA